MPATIASRSPSRRRLRVALPLALALLATGCKPQNGPPGGFPTPVVSVVTVEAKDVPVTYEHVAQTAGFREVEVRARVTGILLKRNYKEGGAVRQGESLFTIDPEPFRVALARAEADLGVAEARLAQAKREAERLKPVTAARAASQKELDDAASAEQVARAEVNSVRARLNEAKLNLEYTRVESPISGIASRALASEGTLVSGPSVLLTTVTQTDPMYVLFGVPDREFLAMRRDIDAGRLKLPENGRLKATERAQAVLAAIHAGTQEEIRLRAAMMASVDEGVGMLLDAGEYEHAGTATNEAIEEAVARYLHEAFIERNEQGEDRESTL